MAKKFLTFSFDDGVRQDERLMEIFRKYAIKATFNVNSCLLGSKTEINAPSYYGKTTRHEKVTVEEVRQGYYDGFEVACHTKSHPLLPSLTDEEVVEEVNTDYKNLSDYCKTPPVGMAYPCAHPNYDERVASLIKERTPLKYARTINRTGAFDKPENLYTWHPTAHFLDADLPSLTRTFLSEDPKEDMLLYVWGHSYEFDIGNNGTWDLVEDFCKYVSNQKDVCYVTNAEYVQYLLKTK